MKQLSVIIIGAGIRGGSYARLMKQMPDKYRIVGVAEPHPTDRAYFRDEYDIPAENCFESWEQILDRPKMADIAVIATVDDMHYAPAMKAISLGYDLLLEKPVSITAQECADIAIAAKNKGVRVLVCHVLRYTNFYGTIKKLLMDGVIGEVVSAELTEPIGHTHFAHSYVRGNWHSLKNSAPMLLAKSCHDLDIAQWLLDKPCVRVHSFGSLTHFCEKNAPAGAPHRCVDGDCPVRETCPYDCLRFYANLPAGNVWRNTVASGITANRTNPPWEDILEGLRTKNYGQCVYHSDNDVVDHQVVSMEFEGGVTATLTVNAFNRGGRYIRIYGTKGELYAFAIDHEITLFTFDTEKITKVSTEQVDQSITGGHGGGDYGIISEMYAYFSGNYTGFRAADIQVSVQNHLIGFAAEQARLTGTVVEIKDYMRSCGIEAL
ncbi:MAG: Gfo/Idh/MocA family oxidoreductase [Ruminococcaceae bacterium]|nr:Gfo/Idh/MocA family oxidoreductase [Oscillospiraceae bacterium]